MKLRVLPVNGRVAKSRQVAAVEVEVSEYSATKIEKAVESAFWDKLPRQAEVMYLQPDRVIATFERKTVANFRIYRMDES